MKFLPAQLAFFTESGASRRNLRLLSRFLLLLAAMIVTYSLLFHVLMAAEGQQHSWITGVYWTLTVMSTLGFGDITFRSDIGRLFSVLVLGSVGRAAARSLEERGITYRIVEQDAARVKDPANTIVGSAADIHVLETAGIRESPTTIVTTSDDATNIYLTIYCRRLRPDMQIISRSNLERNVSTLHRAGADFVMSYAAMGANAVFNLLEQDDVVMIAEGLDVFRGPVPRDLIGRTLKEAGVREQTGCSVVAIEMDDQTIVNPPPDMPLPDSPDAEIIVIGTTESEQRFHRRYLAEASPKRKVVRI